MIGAPSVSPSAARSGLFFGTPRSSARNRRKSRSPATAHTCFHWRAVGAQEGFVTALLRTGDTKSGVPAAETTKRSNLPGSQLKTGGGAPARQSRRGADVRITSQQTPSSSIRPSQSSSKPLHLSADAGVTSAQTIEPATHCCTPLPQTPGSPVEHGPQLAAAQPSSSIAPSQSLSSPSHASTGER